MTSFTSTYLHTMIAEEGIDQGTSLCINTAGCTVISNDYLHSRRRRTPNQ